MVTFDTEYTEGLNITAADGTVEWLLLHDSGDGEMG